MGAVGMIPQRAPEASPEETLRTAVMTAAMAIESQLLGDRVRIDDRTQDACVEVGLSLRHAIERVLHRQVEVFPLPVWLLTPDDDLLRKVAPTSTPSPIPADYRAVQAIRRYPALAAYLEEKRAGRFVHPFRVTVIGPMGDFSWHAYGDSKYLCQINPSLDS